MITKRTSTTTWNNSGADLMGHGLITSESKCINNVQITTGSRYKDESGANPEELVSAAQSSCFTMILIKMLKKAGYKDLRIKTDCTIKFDVDRIIESNLYVNANIPNMAESVFLEFLEKAKNESLITKVLKVKVTVECNFNSNKLGLPDVAILGRNL